MQRNRRHTVYDLTALNLHEDGSRLDLDGHLTSRRALAQRSRAVRDARGNVISRSLPVVPRVRRVRAEEGEGEEVELDEEAEKTAENADEPVAGPSRKRRRLNQLEDPDLVPSTNELDLPSGDLLKCIHHFASKYYTERGMLLNASKDYRRERKERRQNATRQETRTPEDEDDGENVAEEQHDGEECQAGSEQEGDAEGAEQPPPTKWGKRGKAYAESSKLSRDMYKVMDGTALMALGLLLQEHIAQTMGLSTTTNTQDKALKVEETDDWEDDMADVEEVAVGDPESPQPEQSDQLT